MQIIYLTRDLYMEYIKNSHNSVIKRQPNLKMGKDPSRYFSSEDIQIPNKYMKITQHH